jgi:hypothetical protein
MISSCIGYECACLHLWIVALVAEGWLQQVAAAGRGKGAKANEPIQL